MGKVYFVYFVRPQQNRSKSQSPLVHSSSAQMDGITVFFFFLKKKTDGITGTNSGKTIFIIQPNFQIIFITNPFNFISKFNPFGHVRDVAR